MAKRLLRKALSAPGLLRVVRACFDEVNDPVSGRRFSLSDCLMSGLAFGLKYPSASFDRDARTDEVVRANLRALYAIERAPCDTALAKRGGPARAARCVQARVRAAPAWEGAGGAPPGRASAPVDGTGYFSSSRVHSARCEKKRTRHVLPPAGRSSPFVKGETKNDCERCAASILEAHRGGHGVAEARDHTLRAPRRGSHETARCHHRFRSTRRRSTTRTSNWRELPPILDARARWRSRCFSRPTGRTRMGTSRARSPRRSIASSTGDLGSGGRGGGG